MNPRPKIALTIGDPRGIGPEVALSASQKMRERCEIVLYGSPQMFKNSCSLTPAEAGQYSFQILEEAVSDVMAGKCDALVTGPINKYHWSLAEIPFKGHTEFLAKAGGADDVAMMMASPILKVTLATIHEAVKDVPQKLTSDTIVTATRLTQEALRKYFGISVPRIAVAGLNPHCGEGGLMGHEEETIIKPAIDELKKRDINASGPFSADSLFHHAASGRFDAVIAMYHDQGLAAVKTLDYKRTVNITLGLPFIRTSPDHGTAEDIAGKGIADDTNLIAAIEMAMYMVSDTAGV